jgi:predicted permease
MLLLVPSLAPGLSCFPFILEYLGAETLALAALADVGNKVFVLVILYLVAMHWFYRSRREEGKRSRTSKLKELGLSLLREPVNLVILLAIAMLSFGFTVESLPAFLGDTVARLASLMTPVVLLFIGMAVRFRRQEMTLIIRTLCYRSGIAMVLSAGLILLTGLTGSTALLAVIFAQCAVSFWPFAHMAAAEAMREEGAARVFDLDLGLNVLAFSLPFSTVIILAVLSFGDWFTDPLTLLPAAAVLLAGPLIYIARGYLPVGDVEKAQA